MGTLKGRSIASAYKNILQSSTEITNSTLKKVENGAGIATSMRLSTTAAEFQKVGVGTSGVSPDGLFHVLGVSAGAVTASSSANQAVLENVGSCGLSILTGATGIGNIYFGDSNDNDVGQISYDHPTDSFNFSTNGRVSMTLDRSANLNVVGSISEGDERYRLEEFFDKLPSVEKALVTQTGSGTTAVTSNSKYVRLTTVSIDLGATDSVEFIFNNASITANSNVDVRVVKTSGAIVDNGTVVALAHGIGSGLCRIRLATNAVDISAMTFDLLIEVDPHVIPNQNFVLTGTNSVTDDSVQWSPSFAGVNIGTSNSDDDTCILFPRSSQDVEFGGGGDEPTAWTGVKFGTENKIEFKSALSTDSSIDNMGFWSGLKAASTGGYELDVDQAYFLYASDDTLGALTTNANLHFVYSVAGVDYVTDLGIAITANTTYRLRILFDDNRLASVYVNNVRYGLATTSVVGGSTQSITTQKSLALTDDVDLLPVVGVQTFTTATKSIQCHYIKLSRDLFE